jgi:arsenate reductase
MLKVYFKPTCSTCKTALGLLKEETDEEIELYEYYREAPTQKELRELLQMLGLKAEQIVRRKESLYKEKFADKNLTQKEWIKVLSQHPILIERPIVIKDGKAIIGRPPERVLELFKK